MFDILIKLILIFLIVFTPIAFGSIELWAFSIMELGILLVIILWAIQSLLRPAPYMVQGELQSPHSAFAMLFLSLFLFLILFQLLPLPSGVLKVVSPKTWALRHQLLITNSSFELSAFFLSFCHPNRILQMVRPDRSLPLSSPLGGF